LVDQQIIQEASERLGKQFYPERIFLFGSYAQGSADERSDVDFLVVCSFEGSRRKLMVEMDRSLRGLNFARDIVVLTPEEFERDRHIPGTLARPVFQEGQVLYEQS
jgi:predicted nucleotidyltransferase